MKTNLLYLSHIRDALKNILAYVSSEEEFMRDKKTQDAVVRNLEIVGEAAKRLSESYRKQHPNVPWDSMTGMRDVLIHDYDEIDLHEVWKTIESDVRPALSAIETIIDNLPA